MTSQIIITASEMQRLEQQAFQEGLSPSIAMENVGKAIAHNLLTCNKTAFLPVLLLVGRGNNGGDALVAGCHLLDAGSDVIALLTTPPTELSPLAQNAYHRFLSLQGVVLQMQPDVSFSSLSLPQKAIVLDGLLGTGFTPPLAPSIEALIKEVNASRFPVYAIDIPSGISGDLGLKNTTAINAKATFSLGAPKIGLFLQKSWEHVGSLIHVDFGLPPKYLKKQDAPFHLATLSHAATLFPPILRTRHKYQSGSVLILEGAPGMTGATSLASLAALRSGAGIVDILCTTETPPSKTFPLETRELFWNTKTPPPTNKATACLLGLGRSNSEETAELVAQLFSAYPFQRFIADGGALQPNPPYSWPKGTILTPHHGEAELLLQTYPSPEVCQNFVNTTNTILLLKGAPSFLFSPSQPTYIIPFGSPGMATAGSGDVLAGIIAAQLAQNLPPINATLLASVLHGLSGEIAAGINTIQGMIATDIINSLSTAIKKITNKWFD